MTAPAPRKVSSGYLGASDGWTDLRDDRRMDWSYRSASEAGNVAQTALLPLTGVGAGRRLTLALGFGGSRDAAVGTARGTLRAGFAAAAARYADRLPRPPRAPAERGGPGDDLPRVADGVGRTGGQTYRGGGIASPSMAWVWGNIAGYSGPYHLV